MLLEKMMGKISSWYDNEWGFSNRMCDTSDLFKEKILTNNQNNEKKMKILN